MTDYHPALLSTLSNVHTMTEATDHTLSEPIPIRCCMIAQMVLFTAAKLKQLKGCPLLTVVLLYLPN